MSSDSLWEQSMAEEVAKDISVDNWAKKKAITKQLYVLLHSSNCMADDCGVDNCPLMKRIRPHMRSCTSVTRCRVDHCLSSRQMLCHWKYCKRCDVCLSAMSDVYSIPLRKQSTGPGFDNITQLEKAQNIRKNLMERFCGQSPNRTTPYGHALSQIRSQVSQIRSLVERQQRDRIQRGLSFQNNYNLMVNGFDSITLDSSIEVIELDSE